MEALSPAGPLEWSVAERALPGQDVSGDRALVAPFEGGVLLAVIDGLGHGRDACVASEAAVRSLAARAGGAVTDLLKRCHEDLKDTRGAVMSVASLRARDGAVEWLAVGNVEGVLVRADPRAKRTSLVTRGGVVGYNLPLLRASAASMTPGDVMVFATDGIHHAFVNDLDTREAPASLAPRLLAAHARANDDALVLVARYLGAAP